MIVKLLKSLIAYLLKVRIKEIRGMENIPPDEPFIAAANHIGFLDPFFIGAVLFIGTKKKIYFFTKPSIWKVWKGVRKFFGMIPAGYRGVKISYEFFRDNNPFPLVIFPEGKINPGKNLLRAKGGVAKLAHTFRVPVLPIGYFGPASGKISDAVKFIFSPKKSIGIIIGPPIYLPERCLGEKLTRDDSQRMSDEIMRKISALCGKPYDFPAK